MSSDDERTEKRERALSETSQASKVEEESRKMQKQEEDVKPEDEGFNGDVDSKFKDEDLSCVDCSNTFVFTIGEQEFFLCSRGISGRDRTIYFCI